jgi:hypothetical protein
MYSVRNVVISIKISKLEKIKYVGKTRNVHKYLLRKSQVKIPHGRPVKMALDRLCWRNFLRKLLSSWIY